MIAIIDYGMGNIHSVKKALQLMGGKVMVINNPMQLKKCAKAVLPGVGAFGDALLEMDKRGLTEAALDFINAGKPFLGICLGMHMLFDSSEESAKAKGLGVLKGEVVRFVNKKGIKVPHMGWNTLKIEWPEASGQRRECSLLKNVPDNSYVYFCHSYYSDLKDKNNIAATTDYGINFTSAVYKDNIYGVQFHPEKSQKAGLKILKNFINL